MTTAQKIIKYTAGAFALFLAVNILSCILQFTVMVIGGISGWDSDKISYDENFDSSMIDNMDINMSYGKLIIKEGSEFNVCANNVSSDFSCRLDDGTLSIKEKSKGFSLFGNIQNSTLTLTVPPDFTSKKVSIDFSCGKVSINSLDVSEEFLLDCGVGEVDLSDINLNNAEVSLGIGDIDISGILSGNASLDNGIGEIDIDIHANPDNYKIVKDHGIGESNVYNKTNGRYDKQTEPSGNISTDIGIGETSITFR